MSADEENEIWGKPFLSIEVDRPVYYIKAQYTKGSNETMRSIVWVRGHMAEKGTWCAEVAL